MYKEINKSEMDSVLNPAKWRVMDSNKSKEYIYTFPLSTRPHVQIMVCSSIHKKTNVSRGCGHDAIRVFAVNYNKQKRRKPDDIGWIKSKKVYRVESWKSNLQKAVTDVFRQAQARVDA